MEPIREELTIFNSHEIGKQVCNLIKEVDQLVESSKMSAEQKHALVAMFVFHSNKIERTGTEHADETITLLANLRDVGVAELPALVDSHTNGISSDYKEKRLHVLNQVSESTRRSGAV